MFECLPLWDFLYADKDQPISFHLTEYEVARFHLHLLMTVVSPNIMTLDKVSHLVSLFKDLGHLFSSFDMVTKVLL